MKLYYAPETCSLSPHIVLRELDIPFELVRVNNKTKKTADGGDFLAINPKGYVPALGLDNGEVLTEGPAIALYLADLKPEAGLAPPNGGWERVRLQEWLAFVNSEIHAGSSPLFNKDLPEAVRDQFKARLFRRFDLIEARLGSQDYLMGDRFTVADAYLFTVLGWMDGFAVDLIGWPAIASYLRRVEVRPSVKAALKREAEFPPVLE